jgi:hypothetical protein
MEETIAGTYAEEHKLTLPVREQILNGYVGEGTVSAKLKMPTKKQLGLEVLAKTCSVDEYHLTTESILSAIKECEEWRRPHEGLKWWQLIERAKRINSAAYTIECQEGPASLSIKSGDVTLYLPGTITGRANQIQHGWVSDRYIGKISITNPVHLRLSLSALQLAIVLLSN